MNARIFIATTHNGLLRMVKQSDETWKVQAILKDRDFRCLERDPHNPARIYAGTQGAGIWRSDDEGRSWKQVGLEGEIVKAVAISPHDPAVIYAGLKPARVCVSRDGGETWAELDAFREIPGWEDFHSPAEPPYIGYIKALVVSPDDPDVIVAGVEAEGVFRTTDGGESWSDHREEALRDCHQLEFHPGGWVFEAGGGGAAYSSDGGETFTRITDNLDRSYCWGLGVNPAAQPGGGHTWYVSASPSAQNAHHDENNAKAYIYRTRDNQKWERLEGGLPQPLSWMPYELIFDPAESGHLYAGLRSGDIWFSADHGDNWIQISASFPGTVRRMAAFM
jgi:photosystem II stability/assembly factor-like uncharacterized protein